MMTMGRFRIGAPTALQAEVLALLVSRACKERSLDKHGG